MALALAPLGLLLKSQFFRPTVKGRMLFFRGVVGNVTVSVFEVTGQPVTVRQEIIHGRCQRRFGQQFVDIVFCPRARAPSG